MRLTPATQDQAKRLAALMRDFYAGDPSMKPMDAADTLPKVEKLLRLNGKNVHFFSINTDGPGEPGGSGGAAGLDEPGEPHGYVLVTHFYSNEYGGPVALLDELYIAPAHRGQGVGSGVIRALLDWVAERGFCGVMLETTPGNEKARALYARNGFSEINRIFMGRFD